MHTYIHTEMHIYTHTYIHTYINTYIPVVVVRVALTVKQFKIARGRIFVPVLLQHALLVVVVRVSLVATAVLLRRGDAASRRGRHRHGGRWGLQSRSTDQA
jgi:hypothetical protein